MEEFVFIKCQKINDLISTGNEREARDCMIQLLDDLKKNINEWEAYGGTGILYTNSEEVLQEVYRKIEMVE